VVGFGVSTPEQVRTLSALADGIIVGSAVVKQIEAAEGRERAELVARVAAFAGELAAATRG
jgi:tryptophan synthase alpha chain